MTTTTTKTKKDLKVTFNGREVGSVYAQYVSWHPVLDSERHICDECYDENWREECTKCHKDWESLHTSTFRELIAKPNQYKNWAGVTHIAFRTDSTFLTYDALDNNNNIIMSVMIPIGMVGSIHVNKTEQEVKEYDDEEEKINRLHPDVKKSLK